MNRAAGCQRGDVRDVQRVERYVSNLITRTGLPNRIALSALATEH